MTAPSTPTFDSAGRRLRIAQIACLAASLSIAPSVARAAGPPDDTDLCIAAADAGQSLRDEHRYSLARQAFARCSRESCPAIVRRDCAQWGREIDARAPSIVIHAEDGGGRALTGVRATIDGGPTAGADGRAVSLDPGEHTVRCEADGFAAVEEHVVVRDDEKDREVRVRFPDPFVDSTSAATTARASAADVTGASGPNAAAGAGTPSSPGIGAPDGVVAAPEPVRPVPVASWVFGGVAAGALLTGAYFGLTGLLDFHGDAGVGGCAPYCSSSEESAIRTKLLVADIALGTGVASGALAAYFFFADRGAKPHDGARTFDVAPLPGGGVATVRGRFR